MHPLATPALSRAHAVSRRRLLAGATAVSAGFAADARWLWAGRTPDLVLILMADMHAGYAYSAALLKAVSDVVAANARVSDTRIVLNGDLFEAGNVVGARSGGAIDLALLRSLAKRAQTIVTIGNHDSDYGSPEQFVTDVGATGATLITDILDAHAGDTPFGPPSTTFTVKGRRVVATAIGTPALGSYAAAYRGYYNVPQPGAYAQARFPALYADADLRLAFVHAGFMADRAVLPALTGPFMLHGGHDHLRFSQPLTGGNLHLHSGYWSNGFAVVGVNFGSAGVLMRPVQVQLSRTSPKDAWLARIIRAQEKAHLQPADRAVLGTLPAALDLDHASLFAAEAVKRAYDADIGLLNHTTFGDGLPAGKVTQYDLDAFVRFDGGFAAGTIDGATLLGTVLPRTNQYGDFPYANRTGDFLYVTQASTPIDPARSYKVVVNGFAASSPAKLAEYFGTANLTLPAVTGPQLKAIVTSALASGR